MEKKNVILMTLFILIVIASVAATFYKYIVLKEVEFETDEVLFQEALLEE